MNNHIEGVVKRVENNDYETIGARLSKHARVFHGMVGIVTEGGELMDHFKRVTIYGKELDVVNIKEELGDVMWYVGVLMDELGISFKDILECNRFKLEKRFPNAFTEHNALNRDLESERKALEAPSGIMADIANKIAHD